MSHSEHEDDDREVDSREESSTENAGGSFSVDGQSIEIDMAEWGWDRPTTSASGRGSSGPTTTSDEPETTVRLQKALAHAGIASRRACEMLITSGRVTVNGEIERELGSRVDPETDEVRVDGVVVQLDTSKLYFVLNKPRGVVSTMNDEQGRPDLREFTDQVEDRLYNVGRLDTDTSGLLILTNDGELAHKLAHPSFGVQKTYIAKVRGRVTAAVIQQLLNGIELKDGPIHADRAKMLPNGSNASHSLVEITLHSGKNRIVRRMLAEVGHPVEELVRRQFGPLNLGTLKVGHMRELSIGERGALLSSVDGGGTSSEAPGAATRGGAGGSGRAGDFEGAGGLDGKKKQRHRHQEITGGRPGDGKGARGLRGVASRGNPNAGRSNNGGNLDNKPGGNSGGKAGGSGGQQGPRGGRGR